MKYDRRKTLKSLALGSAGIAFLGGSGLISSCRSAQSKSSASLADEGDMFFKISLAQWSFHRALWEGKMKAVDFPVVAKNKCGIEAVEYVNSFYKDHVNDQTYWKALKSKCDSEGVKSLLIMCDGEGNLGELDDKKRSTSVENHYKWIAAAAELGCHSIRVNAGGHGTAEEVKTAAVDGLGRLTEYGEQHGINVIVENHGGYSSNGQWLAEVIAQVNHPNCGTLPDFGNFCIDWDPKGCKKEYDRYQGVEELMPFAKGVSAKSYDFDANGNETHIDFKRMLSIVKQSGFKGYIGIEYEGDGLEEQEGILTTKTLLLKEGESLSS